MGGPSLGPLRPLLPPGEVAQIRASGPLRLGLCPPASGRPDAPVPSLPAGPRPCLKFRISLPGGFPLYLPPPAVGDGGDLPWEEKSLFVPEGLCLRCPAQPPCTPTTTPTTPRGRLLWGWGARLMLGEKCAGRPGLGGPGGPAGVEEAGCFGGGGVSWSPAWPRWLPTGTRPLGRSWQ